MPPPPPPPPLLLLLLLLPPPPLLLLLPPPPPLPLLPLLCVASQTCGVCAWHGALLRRHALTHSFCFFLLVFVYSSIINEKTINQQCNRPQVRRVFYIMDGREVNPPVRLRRLGLRNQSVGGRGGGGNQTLSRAYIHQALTHSLTHSLTH